MSLAPEISTPDLAQSRLTAEKVSLAYGSQLIVGGLSVEIPNRSFTVIVGGNGCGKSTLLRGLARLLRPRSGQVVLDGEPIESYQSKAVARRLSLLPQAQSAPDGIAVVDLVARGQVPAPVAAAAVDACRRAGGPGGVGGDQHHRAGRPRHRRAVRRTTPAGLAGHGARPAGRDRAAQGLRRATVGCGPGRPDTP